MPNLTFHPAANLLPLMDGVAFESLVNDIRLKGLLEPILIHDGQIIDGRNRFNACLKLGIICQTEVYAGDPKRIAEYVLSRNVQRRHLSGSQKACVGLVIESYFASHRGESLRGIESRDAAGRAMFVSGRYIGQAKRLKIDYPALFKMVFDGHLPLSKATRQVIAKENHRPLSGIRVIAIDLATGQQKMKTVYGLSVEAVINAFDEFKFKEEPAHE